MGGGERKFAIRKFAEIVKPEFWKHYSEWGKERMGEGKIRWFRNSLQCLGCGGWGEERKFAICPFGLVREGKYL